MKYLLDTNIWLERLLQQAQAENVGRFLAVVPRKNGILKVFKVLL